jgi:hypothetical protein
MDAEHDRLATALSAAERLLRLVQNGATPEEQTSLRATVHAPVIAIFSRILGRRCRRTVPPVWAG